jgi:hypothetical protein
LKPSAMLSIKEFLPEVDRRQLQVSDCSRSGIREMCHVTGLLLLSFDGCPDPLPRSVNKAAEREKENRTVESELAHYNPTCEHLVKLKEFRTLTLNVEAN